MSPPCSERTVNHAGNGQDPKQDPGREAPCCPFAVGDVVRLKSGGPAMTISTGKLDEDGETPCDHFIANGQLTTNFIRPDLLERVTRQDPKQDPGRPPRPADRHTFDHLSRGSHTLDLPSSGHLDAEDDDAKRDLYGAIACGAVQRIAASLERLAPAYEELVSMTRAFYQAQGVLPGDPAPATVEPGADLTSLATGPYKRIHTGTPPAESDPVPAYSPGQVAREWDVLVVGPVVHGVLSRLALGLLQAARGGSEFRLAARAGLALDRLVAGTAPEHVGEMLGLPALLPADWRTRRPTAGDLRAVESLARHARLSGCRWELARLPAGDLARLRGLCERADGPARDAA